LRPFVLPLAVALLAAGAGVAHAQPQTPVIVPTAGGDVTVLADNIEQIGADNMLIATGNVEITRGKSRLMADRVEINRETGDAVAQGRVVFYDGEDQLTGQRIDYNLKTGTGVVYQAEVRAAPYYRITGEQMDRLGEGVYRVHKGTFTTCEDDAPAWSFHFGTATADLEDYVYGFNASFWVKNVPLIPFFPIFAAAIRRERQTGFLFPKFGNSSSKGVFGEIPFYWAISDSQDVTIALDYYSRRGEGFTGEYRYVLSSNNRGHMRGFVLQESAFHDATRWVGNLSHEWTLAPKLTFKADVNGVSDDNIFKDYGDPVRQRSAQRVESNVFLTRTWEAWNLVGNLFWYQDLTISRPVELQRLPDISLQGVRQPLPGVPGALYEMDASFVHFMRDVGSEGSRLDLHPRLSRPISPGGLFTVTPFVGGRLTAYDKTVVGFRTTRAVTGPIEVTDDEPQLRRLAEAGSDLEMRISRVYQVDGFWGYEALLHSIEPRMTYTWVTGQGQERLPIWTEGIDRIPDSSRIEYSLTNRIRGKSATLPDTETVRWELLRLELAHSYELRTSTVGNVRGSLIVQPTPKLRFRSDTSYDVQRGGIELATTDASVALSRMSLTVGNRYSDTTKTNFVQASLTAEVTRFANVRASTNWDIRSNTFVENRLAMDLKFQCWAVTVEFVNRNKREDEVRFAVNLLGIGGPIQTSVGVGALESPGQK
jgi:LPS-assembly protein